MTKERWGQIKAAFEAALGQPAEKREECVRILCRQDSELEAEVRALLEANDSAGSFLHKPAVAVIGCPPEDFPHTLAAGEVLAGRFEILRFLNSGGMGEVYEAWDRELREYIALKTIRPEIASSPAVLERFKQEVRRARGISHANVCRVYDLFNHPHASGQTIWFLTMELLRGQTLAEWLRNQGPVRPEKALELVRQMVAGLAAAHELEIVHRDFKTGNVMLVDAGKRKLRAVVTDFGLALNVGEDALSGPGASGTPDYMAPEQSRGESVGFAADQFALGIMMCEMLAGRRPQRVDGQAIFPPEHHFPHAWAVVIRRCLQIRPQDRFPGITQVLSALDPQRRRKIHWWTGAAAAAILTLAVLAWIIAGNSADRVQDEVEVTGETDLSTDASLSRDGKTLAYISDRAGIGRADIWVQRLPATSAPIRVATGASPDKFISISPDGSSVVFRSERDGGSIYLAMTAKRGDRLLAAGGRDPRFSPDGRTILYWKGDRDESVQSGQLYVIPVAGGTPVRIAANFKDARYGVWSPDGQYILFTGCKDTSKPLDSCREWWAAGTDGKRLENTGALAVLHNQGIALLDNTVGGWYGNDNRVLFSGIVNNANSLWEIHLSSQTLRADGPARQLTPGRNRELDPSLADDGTVAYGHLVGAAHIWRIENALSPGSAVATRITDEAEVDGSPHISHNGRWLVFTRGLSEHHHIEIRDLNLGNTVPMRASYSDEVSPMIDDSGTKVVFEAKEEHTPGIFITSQGDPVRKICSGCNSPSGWFDGSRAILYREGFPSSIKMTYLDREESRILLESNGLSLANASWSPENQYLLFTASTVASDNRIFAVRLPGSTGKIEGSWIPITGESEWSDRPRWSGDGKTVFYVSTRDGFHCIWGRHFDPQSGKARGLPFAVMHYHNLRVSPALVVWKNFGLATAGDSIYLDPGEENETIWVGKLKRQTGTHFLERFW